MGKWLDIKWILAFLTVLSLLFCDLRQSRAMPVFESATLGSTGVFGGVIINEECFIGTRFEVNTTITTESIGGHFSGFDFIFGSIVELDGFSDFPNSLDMSTPDVLGATLISPTFPSEEVKGNLPLTLAPGIYALVFGSGLFGANGVAWAPVNNVDTGSPSYFFRNTSSYINGGFFDTRLFLEGAAELGAVPEPNTMLLVGTGLAGIAGLRRKFSSWTTYLDITPPVWCKNQPRLLN